MFYWTCRVPSIRLAQHQINPVIALSSYFLMIYFNNILPPIPKSSQRPFSTRYPATILCPFLFYTSHVIFPAHFIFLHFISLKTLNYTPAVHWTHLTQLPWSSLSSQKAKCCWWSHCLAQWYQFQSVQTEHACFLGQQPEICSLHAEKRNATWTGLHVKCVLAQCCM